MKNRKKKDIFNISLGIIIFLVLFLLPYHVGAAEVGDVKDYSYTGSMQSFTAPVSGYYQLEGWGGQGYTANGRTGGYGAYTTGVVRLQKNETIYIAVGNQGTGGATSNYSSWSNGGTGRANDGKSLIGAGGASTNFTTINKFLASITTSHLEQILLVAAGGGSSTYGYNNAWSGYGGHGGGISGNNGTNSGSFAVGGGGTQTSGGAAGNGCSKGAFGVGATGAAAGGGGFYGGGCSWGAAGGGGSSYVGNGRLISYDDVVKSSYCYSCQTSTVPSTYTVNTTSVSSSAVAQTAKSGKGAARITLLYILSDEARLSDINVSKGVFDKPFDKDTYTYDVVLGEDDYNVDISATAVDSKATVVGEGNFNISSKTTSYNLVVTAEDGTVATYVLNITRPPSSYKYLSEIKINDKKIDNFQPEKLEYTVNLSYDQDEISLSALFGRPSQIIDGVGTFTIPSGVTTKNIEVTAEDKKSTTTYKIHFVREHSSKLKSLEISGYNLEPSFNREIYKYEVNILSSDLSLNVNAIAYDEEATITLDGFGYINKTKTATITVKEPNSTDTVYTIKIVKGSSVEQIVYDFPYTGGFQQFTSPIDGFYKLETWGAQGYSVAGYIGGYGAYAVGATKIKKDETVYVNVGGAGVGGLRKGFSSYPNGGDGNANDGVSYVGAGGSSTNITTTRKNLVNITTANLKEILMVAAGGGAATWTSGNGWYGHGGAGGGITGNRGGTRGYFAAGGGGSQTAGGAAGNGGNRGAFGKGANGGGTGGGGGFYGGGSSWGAAGGGGSSYIANPKLRSYKEVPRVMYCYYCQTSDAETTATETTANYSSTPTPYYAKAGNGHARITLMAQLSKNNFLSEITTDKGTITPIFDMINLDYKVKLTPDDDTINIGAILEDETAEIIGTGEFDVPAGKTVFPLTVTAENGDIRIYTVEVERDPSSNSYPNNIIIEGLIPNLCSIKDEYCKLDREFNPDTASYHMTVPSRLKNIEFVVEKGHKYQTVKGDGKITLETGMNEIVIEVTSEDGEHISTYTYYINRDMSGDNTIEKLEVIDPVTDIEFDPDTTEYYFSIPDNYSKVGLKVTLEDVKATYEVIGNENFKTGLNIVEIVVTAQNGDKKTYTLNIYREQSGNTFLSSLEVSNDREIFDLNPKFNKIISTYTVKVENEVDEVEIKTTTEHPLTVVTGDGTKTLKVGTNVFQITSTAEDGSVQIYEVAIIRLKNSDATLKTLDVLEGALSPSFQSGSFEYSVNVNPGVTSLNLNVEPTASTSKYVIDGNYGFKVGADNVVSIVVTAEDGTKNTYTIHVNRLASTNNYLSYLSTDKYDMTDIFNKETEEYSFTVLNEVSKLSVVALKEDPLATLMGNGTYQLDVGNNDIFVIVTAEDGTSKTYTLHVFRKYNSNANLISLTTDTNIAFNQTFDKDTLNYSLTVGSEVNSIAIVGIAESLTSKVTGNGVYQLNSGENLFKILVTAEDGTEKEYSLLVVREKSNNANLSMIIAKESVLDPSFDKDKTEYVLKVIESVTDLNLLITKEDEKATYEIVGNMDFEIGHNTVVIKVTAEDGITTKEYVLDVLRQVAGTTSNRLVSLEVDHGTLDPVFDKDTNYYEVEVPYEVADITLSGELEDKNATVTGFSTYQLNVGVNVLSVKVTSVENVVRYYQVVVTRKENDEARLASLQIADTTLSPNFNKDVYQYNITTTDTELVIQAVPLDSEASVEIIGNNDLVLGDNQVIIRVTAKDKKTKKDYVLNIVREKSNNNNLESLEVVDHTITPSFSNSNTVYYLNVGKDVEQVNIKAVAEDKNATITGDGLVTLTSSITYAYVKVTSESGKEKAYTIIIIREQSSNNYLDRLEVSSGTLSPEFKKTDNNYAVVVPYGIEDINISGSPEDDRSTVTGFGIHHLQIGVNMIPITVRAEDGSVNIYYLEVTREKLVSSKLKELSVQSYLLDQTFYPEVYDYNVSVDSEVDSLVLNIVPEDVDATYRVVGNSDFVVGMNIVKIIVTDSLGKDTSTYTLNVSKQNYSNTFLAYIYTSQGTLSPNFIKTKLDYTVHVGNEVEEVEVLAEAEVSTNTLTGDGVYHLVPGDNMVELKVETPTGISRVYHVNIIREKNSKNHLLNLQVKVNDLVQTLMPEFNRDVLEYSLDVANDVTSIEILGKSEDGATISGLGVKLIKSGVNLYQITVTSEDGEVRIYQLTVNKEQSDNNRLINIIPSIGTLNPTFNYNQDEYSLVLDASASVLSFDVEKEDVSSKVTGIALEIVPDGLSKREIVVEAEDGSKKIYTINVYKERSDEARLSKLEIDGYTFNETFDKDNYNYTLTVPNDKSVILSSEVEAVALDSSATVTKTSSLMLSSTALNIYTVVVTAKDGFTKKTYTITIDREKGSDSTLAKLEFAIGNLTEPFIPSKTEYTLQVSKNSVINKNNVEAIPTDSDATVIIPEVVVTEDGMVYEIVVESPDKSSRTTYKINLEIVESSNALLSDLSVDNGVLMPKFDKMNNNYTLELDSEIDELEISATAEDVNSVITGVGKQSVVTGLNRYEIVVTAEDGTVNTYVIEATRGKSANTNIVNIIPSSGSLSPSYSNEVDHYEVVVSEEIDTIDFEVLLESKRATVTGAKNNSLNYGDNDLTLIVTAEDGTVKEVYVKVIREKKVTDIETTSEIVMEVGDIETINVNITPEDATNKELIWEVEDSSIVSVEDGVVTGLSLGETSIKVTSKTNEEVSKTIKVRVLNLKITSDIYDVRREEVYPYIIGAEQGEKFSEFITKLNNEAEFIHFYNADDTEISDLEGEQIKTGSYITIEYKDKVYDKVYIAVRGEINGDGEINVKDYNEAVSHTLKKKVLEDFWFVVANVDEEESGIINVKDSNKIQNKLLKKIPSLNP